MWVNKGAWILERDPVHLIWHPSRQNPPSSRRPSRMPCRPTSRSLLKSQDLRQPTEGAMPASYPGFLDASPALRFIVTLPLPLSHLSQQPHVFDCIYGHLICASSQDQIYLQVLISFRLIEVQAHEVSVFDPQIGYESQSNRLIFTHSRCPGLQTAREKSMRSANDSQFIEQLPF